MRQINIACATYIMTWMSLPFLEVGTLYRIIAIGAVLLWLFTVESINPYFYKENSNVFLIGTIFVVCSFIGNFLLQGLGGAISDTVNTFIIVILFLFYFCYKETDYLHTVATMCVVLFLIVGGMTLVKLWQDPRAARDAYLLYINGDASGITSIASYGFIMTAAIVAPVSLNVALNKMIDKKERLLYISLFVVLTLMVFKASYTTAVILLLLSFLFFLMYHNYSQRKMFLIIVIVLLVLFFWKFLLSTMLEFTLSVVGDNATYRIRLQELYDFLILGTQASGDLADRMSRYTKTWNELWKNPVFGAALLRESYHGGGHSEYLDAIAKFGIVYFLCDFWFTLKGPLRILKSYGIRSIYVPFAACIFVLCIIDPYAYVIMLAGAIILPNMAELLLNNAQSDY